VEVRKKHIFLIGFMGSGKTSNGKLLSKQLNFDFLDTDRHIEEEENRSIQEIFDTNGEAYFRGLERQLLEKICFIEKPTVISTGGGMPIYLENIHLMLEHGWVVFLNISLGKLYYRLKNDKKRPLLQSEEQLYELISNKLKERMPIYSQADIVVDAGMRKTEILEQLLEKLNPLLV
jgi:shikimate kinase